MRPDWREVPRGDGVQASMAGMYVTMNPKGLIAMSRVTWQRMGEPKAFVLLFDTVNNRIGLRPASLETKNAYPLLAHTNFGGKKINAYRLVVEYRIELPETVQFYDAWPDDDGVLVLDLRTAKVCPRRWKEGRSERRGGRKGFAEAGVVNQPRG
jgi:hypothetical protein